MGLFLYNLGIRLYWWSAVLLAAFNQKAKEFVLGRRRIFADLKAQLGNGPVIWFHCSSLGEFEQGRPVLEGIRKSYKDHKILVTFFSPSGYNVRKHYDGADCVTYMPLDTSSKARKFIEKARPELAVFIKYEYWYHHFSELNKRNIPVVIISSIFRSDQVFFKKYGSFYRNILSLPKKIFTQDSSSLKLLKEIGIERTAKAGDTRFDRVWKIQSQSQEIDGVASFKSGMHLLIIGSCWKEDLDVLLPYINNAPEGLKFMIAPHEVTARSIQTLEKQIKLSTVRFSRLGQDNGESRVLIVDGIGLLSKLYKYGEFAFIGGAYGDGLHNILEPAAFGLPVFFGNKNYQKFREAEQLIEAGGAFAVKDYYEFEQKFNPMLEESYRSLTSEIVSGYVKSNTGATNTILKYLNGLIDEGNSN